MLVSANGKKNDADSFSDLISDSLSVYSQTLDVLSLMLMKPSLSLFHSRKNNALSSALKMLEKSSPYIDICKDL